MAASSIFFNGRVISVPGSYSEVDASGLGGVGLGATGIVAVLGTSEGGKPASAITETKDFLRFSKPSAMGAAFRSGQLRDVAEVLFEPGRDADIPAGAVQVIAMKCNPATQSVAALQKDAVDVITLKSRDYGAFTEQINVELADGTTKGKALTVTFENITQAVDDLGGDALATLQYSGGANGFTTATAAVNDAGDITVAATRTAAGQDNLVDNAVLNAAVEVLSSDPGDTTQTVTLHGTVGGVYTETTVALNGTTPVSVATIWDAGALLGVELSAATAGTVTVRNAPGGTSVFTVPAGTLREGVALCEYHYVNKGKLTLVADGATTRTVLVKGKTAAGSVLREVVTLTGAAPLETVTATFAEVTRIVVGNLEAARTLTVTVEAAKSVATVQKTLQKAADYFNAKQAVIAGPTTRGFIFTVSSGKTLFSVADLDLIASTGITTALNLTANVFAIADWINTNSTYVEAEVVANPSGVPDNTAQPLFLSGGSEGTATFSDFQNALNLLKKVRVNSIVDLSGDDAVAAAVDAHCAYMCGIGRSERDGFVGVLNNAGDDVPTKTEYKAAIVNLNSRHIRVAGQAIERFVDGKQTELQPPFLAALLAGAQAGSAVGTSLTHKYMNVLSFRQDPSWNPVDDAEEMIQAGACFLEDVEGVGRRVVRNVTSHLSTDNIAYTEGSVNEAINFAVFEFRTGLEFVVGKKGFSGTIGAMRSVSTTKLDLLRDETIITAYRALNIELLRDVAEVSVDMAPVIPINFVKSTVHLVTLQQLAAAAA